MGLKKNKLKALGLASAWDSWDFLLYAAAADDVSSGISSQSLEKKTKCFSTSKRTPKPDTICTTTSSSAAAFRIQFGYFIYQPLMVQDAIRDAKKNTTDNIDALWKDLSSEQILLHGFSAGAGAAGYK